MIMKYILIFLLTLYILPAGYAQKCENVALPSYNNEGRLLYVYENNLYASIDMDGRVDKIIKSTDNGQTWAIKNILPQGGFIDNTPWIKDGANLFAGGCDTDFTNSYILRSTDNGDTWKIFYQYGNGGDLRVACASGDTIICQYNNGPLSLTIDGGKSWVANNTFPFSQNPMNFQFMGNRLVISDYYIIYATSVNLGMNWEQNNLFSKPDGTSLSFIYGSKYFVTADRTYNSQLFYNTDLGAHWDTCKGLPYGQHNLKCLSVEKYLFDIYTYLGNSINGNAVFVSSDSGKNWQRFAYDFPSDVTDLFSGSEYYFLSSWGTIWRFSKSGISAVNSQASKNISFSLTCFPNPASTLTHISYSVPHHSEVLIQAFDIMGREITGIANGSEDAGSHEVIWDTKLLLPGSYLIRLTSGGESVARVVEVIRK
jgi:photosystem II stability/assembly factor-like uncharacterized protein